MTATASALLLRSGLITEAQLAEAERLRQRAGGTVGESLVQLGAFDEEVLVEFFHRQLLVPRVAPERFRQVARAVVATVPADMAAEFGVFPIDIDAEGTLTLAMADPADAAVADEVSFFTARFCQRAVAPPSSIRAAIRQYYSIDTTPGAAPEPSAAPAPPPELGRAPAASRPAATPAAAPAQVLEPAGTHQAAASVPSDFAALAATPPSTPAVMSRRVAPAAATKTPPPASAPTPPRAVVSPPSQPRSAVAAPVAEVAAPASSGGGGAAPPDPPLLELRRAGSREVVANLLLNYVTTLVPRACLFVVRRGMLVGYAASGMDLAMVRQLRFPVHAPSLFRDVMRSRVTYRGPLLPSPVCDVVLGFFGELPGDTLLFPIAVREKVVALLFADGVTGMLPDAFLHAAAREVSRAFERFIIASKESKQQLS